MISQPKKFKPAHEPTPEEIADKCRQIRLTWTDGDRLRRTTGPRQNVDVVRVSLSELPERFLPVEGE